MAGGSSVWEIFGDDEDDEEQQQDVDKSVTLPVAQSPPPWGYLLPSGNKKLASVGCTTEDLKQQRRNVLPNSACGGVNQGFPFQHQLVHALPCLQCIRMERKGGGRGVTVRESVGPGTVLLAERPLVSAKVPDNGDIMHAEARSLWSVLCLPENERSVAIIDLSHFHPQSLDEIDPSDVEAMKERHQAFLEKLSRDSEIMTHLDEREIIRLLFALRQNAFSWGAIFPNHAMLNHSCRPNALKLAERGENSCSETLATEVIPPNAEVTVYYLESRELTRDERRSRLLKQFGFSCECELCQCEGPAAMLEAHQQGMSEKAASQACLALSESMTSLEGGGGSDLWWLEALGASLALRIEALVSLDSRHISIARVNKFVCHASAELLVLCDSDLEDLGDDKLWKLIGKCFSDVKGHDADRRSLLLGILFEAALELRKTQLIYLGPASTNVEAAQPLEYLAQAVQHLSQRAAGRQLLKFLWPFEGNCDAGAFNKFEAECGKASKIIQYQ